MLHDNEDYPYHDTAWFVLVICKIACRVSMKQVNNTFDTVIPQKHDSQPETLLDTDSIIKSNKTSQENIFKKHFIKLMTLRLETRKVYINGL